MVRKLISLSLVGALFLVVGCSKPEDTASPDAGAAAPGATGSTTTTPPTGTTAKAPSGAATGVAQQDNLQVNPNGTSAQAGTALKGK